MTMEKKRIELLLTKPYHDALNYLIEEGIHFNKQEAIRVALRIYFGTLGIPPFYPQEESL